MNPSVQMASPSASSCNCTWNTRNMQHVCNPQCLLKCASRAHQTMDFSSKQARSTLSWSRAAWSIYNRWQTLHSGIDYIMMMPMMLVSQLWYQSSASCPVCSLLQWRALRTGQSQPRLIDWPIRARGRSSLLCAGCEMMRSRLRCHVS